MNNFFTKIFANQKTDPHITTPHQASGQQDTEKQSHSEEILISAPEGSNQTAIIEDPQNAPKIQKKPFTTTIPKKNYRQPSTVLLILDGWGIGPDTPGNAITQARTPNLDRYWLSYPHTQLIASGPPVGLPKGADGNTETGHLNIGAGTIVYQELARINNSIQNLTFFSNQALIKAIYHAKNQQTKLHLMGLTSSGNVHSNLLHLYSLLDLCRSQNFYDVYIHAFTDGRDSAPTSSLEVISNIINTCQQLQVGQLASLMGRYYAMDRDKKWDRIEKAYNCLTIGCDQITDNPLAYLQSQHEQKIFDEFITPINVTHNGQDPILINDNDSVIFFNFRVDRPRELTRAFVMPDFEQGISKEDYDPYIEKYYKTSLAKVHGSQTFKRQRILNNLNFVTMTTYETSLPVEVAFPMQDLKGSIGSTLAYHGLRQLRVTETEKERFVTSYLNAKAKEPFPGEEWIIHPSKGVKAYDQVPEMSALEISQSVVKSLKFKQHDSIIANICNGDMVGHTGNLEACIIACEAVDRAVGLIVNTAKAQNATVIITADHGNVEEVINNETGEIDTEHSSYPVPFIIVNNAYERKPRFLNTGILADIAPTILHLMDIEKPESMTGRTIINKNFY